MANLRRLAHFLAAAMLAAPAAPAAPDGPRVIGPPETVYDWASQRCATWDIPDTPARAWRDAGGAVHLVAGSEASRAATGAGLTDLARGCAVLFVGGGADDPGAYDDRAWIHATWTDDGAHVTALAHVEYHGDERPGRCASPASADCWRNAIVELRATDGGRRSPRAGLAAALPWRYSAADGRRAGYFNPSNILRIGDDLYAFVWTEAFKAQRRGACLIRRPVDGGPADWRAWDGQAFATRFADPYREDVADPAAHACVPLPSVASTISSVVRTATGAYLAVTPATRRRGERHLVDDLGRSRRLERARAHLARAAALAPRLRRARGLRLSRAPRPGQPLAQLRHSGRHVLAHPRGDAPRSRLQGRSRARPYPPARQLAFAMTAGVNDATSAAGSARSPGPITGAS